MKNIICVGVIIENEKGEILLGQKENGRIYPGCWILPGGAVEEGEKIEEAVKREVKEETNLEVEIVRPVNFSEDFTWKINRDGQKDNIHIIALNYKTKLSGGNLEARDDLVNPTWVTKDKLKELKHNPLSRELFTFLGWI